ncbi:helix-turn-helix domain-containing protein [Arthrobacter sp. zg-Y1219]|uniref:TetR/AcrR family transcriptional regulator n=1 Tax=Arthrobacter sp. zg-Y1219 TaxID=3049067 RepID=UPI0024C20FE4|nr:helix-turn-helix domain-containing protein [Arthrobacter sp. zg-Y1219]MDK1360763.1 helix-turn-helix domain-containing protein [Arthrobacter sp. zg-Y1219]
MQGSGREEDIGGWERLDAARNRRLLLGTALAIVSEAGVDALTMDDLARRAGVGKGTVFRRFGSRAGLMQALLDHAQRGFQESYMRGPAPLGPGAQPLERLHAFGQARIRALEITGELRRAAAVDGFTHHRHATRQLELLHLTMLLSAVPAVRDPELTAYQLEAFLEAGLLLHLHRTAGMPLDRIIDGWTGLVASVTGSSEG